VLNGEHRQKFSNRRNINRGYLKLDAWVRAQDLVKLVYEILDRSSSIGFKLRDQIIDAVTSIPSNVSEGYCRRSVNEYLQFCYVALGSAGELFSRLVSLRRSGRVTEDDFESFDRLHWELENRIMALVRSLERKRDEGSWNQSMP
jgi:four helix bundle protein